MGAGESSRHQLYAAPEPAMTLGEDQTPVEYHMVGCTIAFGFQSECGCFPKVDYLMDGDELSELLSQQYSKGYRLLYLTRMPGDLQVMRSTGMLRAIFQGFFRMNPNLGTSFDKSVTWQLRMERSFLRSTTKDSGSFLNPLQSRQADINAVVDCIRRNTQSGERLVSALVTGHSEGASYADLVEGIGPNAGVDLYFEVPSPGPCEVQVYNIVCTPVHVEFCFNGFLFFPGIPHNWGLTFNDHLKEGWRLVDIFVDIPMVEQMRVPIKTRRRYCRPMDTNVYWFFEKPASRAHEKVARYEGTIVEHPVTLQNAKRGYGITSYPKWQPIIQDMGSRGWELSCAVECHAVESRGFGHTEIKSLLFFQRPVSQE